MKSQEELCKTKVINFTLPLMCTAEPSHPLEDFLVLRLSLQFLQIFFLPLQNNMLTTWFCSSGPVVMDMSGYTERGFKRKLAVQTLFGKVFYLSEVSTETLTRWL